MRWAGILWLLLLGAALWHAPVRLSLFALQQTGHDLTVQTALGATRLRQSFYAHYPGLSEIEVNVTGFVPPLGQAVTLRLQTAAEPTVIVRQVTGVIGDFHHDWKLSFPFTPIDESAAQLYVLEIETPGPAPLQLMTHSSNVYSRGELAQGGDLMFTARYRGLLAPTLLAFSERLTARRPGALARPWVYLGLAGLYGVLTGGIWLRIARYAWRVAYQPPRLRADEPAQKVHTA